MKCTLEEMNEFKGNSMFFTEQAIRKAAINNNIAIKDDAQVATIPIDGDIKTVFFAIEDMWTLELGAKTMTNEKGVKINIAKELAEAREKQQYCIDEEIKKAKLEDSLSD